MKHYLRSFFFGISVHCSFTNAYAESSCENELVLTLESALSRALNYNRQLLNTQDVAVKAEYQVSVAYSEFDLRIKPNADAGYVGGGKAGAGPAVGLGADFQKKFAYGTIVNVNPLIQKAGKSFRTILNSRITQPLLRGYGKEYTLSNLYGAQFAWRTATRAFFIAQCQLIFRAISALYDFIKAERNVVLNGESHSRLEKFYRASLIKAKIGLSDPLDVYRAETELHHAEDALRGAQERLQDTQDTIRDILALPPETKIVVDVPLFYSESPMGLEEAVGIALQNRIEIDQSSEQKIENIRLSRIAKDKLWPELNLVLNYNNLGNDEVFAESWRRREITWGIGFTTSTDFNPAAERAAYEQSLIGIQTAQRGMDQINATVIFEVKRALRNLDRASQRIEIQEKQMKNAEGELRLAQIKFDRGMGNNFDLIQAEKSLRTAQLGHWNALIDHILGEYQLRAALGVLMEKPCL